MDKLDQIVEQELNRIKDDFVPLFYKDFLGLSLMVWNKPELHADYCATEPYDRDGSVPLVFVQVAWFELMFYNRTIYNYLYKRDRGYLPEVLGE